MYIDAYHNSRRDVVYVVERNEDGNRVYQEYPVDHSFYYESKDGPYSSIFGHKCEQFVSESKKNLQKELKRLKLSVKTFESDLKPAFKVFEKHYKDSEPATLNVSFFDIETDFCKERGFAPIEDPFNPITAISTYNNWEDVCYTLVVAPKGMTKDVAEAICDEFDNTILCPDEKTMLMCYLTLIEDADVLTGWNSEGYDIPYTIGRIIRVLGKDFARKMCLWDQMPKTRLYERYGKETMTFDLVGRVHLDYLALYGKYTYNELPSFSLDYVGKHEVKEQKVAYEGSLDDLYNFDFKKFIAYNRQDTMLMVKIDAKLKLINLTNTLAHENCVLMQTTMGAVALSDQAILLEAHKRNLVVPDRNRAVVEDLHHAWLMNHAKYVIDEGLAAKCYTKSNMYEVEEMVFDMKKGIPGAYVAAPQVGISRWIGSVDITSLYPSIIMALNISPETLVAQVDQLATKKMIVGRMLESKKDGFAYAWGGHFESLETGWIFNKTQDKVQIDFNYAGQTIDTQTVTAQKAYNFIFESGNTYCISANGTIFDHKVEGVIPSLLARWFTERKELQGKAKAIGNLINGIEIPDDMLKKL